MYPFYLFVFFLTLFIYSFIYLFIYLFILLYCTNQINRNIQLFVRAPTEQWACYRSIAFTKERHINDMDSSSSVHGVKALTPTGPGQNNLRNLLAGNHNIASLATESQFVVSAVLEVLSISLLLLCTRTLHEAKPVSDMLQVLGILAQADHMKILQRFDETIWRTLLVACASTGGDVMRKVACVIFDTLTACGITPDALTYGSYTRALAATKYSSQNSTNGQQMDQFLFLEEIGLGWFQQRSAVIEQSQSDLLIPDTRGAAPKGGMLSTMFNRKKRPSALITRRRVSYRSGSVCEMTGAGDSAMTTAAQLGLVRPPAAFCLLCPSGPFILAPPRYSHSFPSTKATQDLSSELSGRIGKLMLDYKPPSPPDQLDAKHASTISKGMKATNIDISMFTPPEKKNHDNDDRGTMTGNDLNDTEASKDLFGPGRVAISTDSLESLVQRENNGNNDEDDIENRGSAYTSSALGAAVSSSSSAAASTVKHYGNMMIAGIPAIPIPHTLRQSNAVPLEVLQDLVRSSNSSSGSHSPLVIHQHTTEIEPAPTSPVNRGLSRMASINRLTQSVFINPFATSKDKEKDKEKEKEKEKVILQNKSSTSLTHYSSTPPLHPQKDQLSSVVKSAASKMMPGLPSFYNRENAVTVIATRIEDQSDDDGRERKGSLISIRFSDDEGDDSDDEAGGLSRKSSSASIRTKDKDGRNSRRHPSISSEPSVISIDSGKPSVGGNNVAFASESNPSLKLNAITPVRTTMRSMSNNGSSNGNNGIGDSNLTLKTQKGEEDGENLDGYDVNHGRERNDLLSSASSLIIETKDEEKKNEKNSKFFQTPFSPSYIPIGTNSNSPLVVGEGEVFTPNLSPILPSAPQVQVQSQSSSEKNVSNEIKIRNDMSKTNKYKEKEIGIDNINEDEKGLNRAFSDISPLSTLSKINKPPKPIPIQIPKLPVPVNNAPPASFSLPTKKAFKPIPTQIKIQAQGQIPTPLLTQDSTQLKMTPPVVAVDAISTLAGASGPRLDSLRSPVLTPPLPPSYSTPLAQVSSSNFSDKRVNVLAMQADVNSIFSSAFIREGSAIGIHCATPCPICNHTLLDEEVRIRYHAISYHQVTVILSS